MTPNKIETENKGDVHQHTSKETKKEDGSAQQEIKGAEETKKAEENSKLVKKEKKGEASAAGMNLRMSLKQGMYLCKFIKNKSLDEAMKKLDRVILLKEAVPFKGEIPHRHGMMSGRYPINASKRFITSLKGLRGNCIAQGLDMEKVRITYASASWASRPARSGGRHMKRVHLFLNAHEI